MRAVVAVVGGLGLSAGLAMAGGLPALNDYSIFKVRTATQTSDAPPAGVDGYFGVQRITSFNGGPAFFGTATVSSPSTGSRAMSFLNPGDPTLVGMYVFSSTFASEADLNAFLPADRYTFTITGGAYGDASAVLDVPQGNLWSSQPHIANYSALQGVSVGSPVKVSYDVAALDPGAVGGGVFWTVTGPGGVVVQGGFRGFGDPGTFTISEPLQQNATYTISLAFSARQFATEPGTGVLASAQGFVAFDSVTTATFTTAPTPGSVALLGVAGLAVLRRRR